MQQKKKPLSAMLALIGANWPSYLGALIATVMDALERAGLLDNTVELNVEKRYDIMFRYGENYTCELGDVEKLDSKLQMILKVMESNPDDVTATIDASDANKVYYRPQYE